MKQIHIALLALIFATQALAATPCDAESATKFAQNIYNTRYNFYDAEEVGVKALVSPALYHALQNHYSCEGVCHLDYDPWLGAQDGKIGPPITFETTKIDKTGATVEMHYQFLIAPTKPAKSHIVLLKMKPSAPPQCWQLNDLVTPIGDSLLKAYSKKE